MYTQSIPVGPFEVNCSFVWNDQKDTLIIDPGCDAADIETVLKEKSLKVTAWLLTHGHADHISALAELQATHPAPIYMHPADQKWAFGPMNQIEPYYSVPPKPDTELIDPTKQPPCDGAEGLKTIVTPGHTPGGVCYWFKEAGICFTGDTLFKGSAGRTDLPGGDARTLTASLKTLAETLPPETRLVAGHGDDTTMEHELATNFFMQRFQR